MSFALATAKAERAPAPTVKPSPTEEKFVRDAMAYLVFRAPFFAHILYNEMRIDYVDIPEIPVAATDAHAIFINVTAISKYKLTIPEMAFILAHEISHFVFGDLVMGVKWRQDKFVICPSQQLDYDHGQMNKAMDYRINAMLIQASIGQMPQHCPGLFEPSLSARGMESCVEIYEKIYRKRSGGGGAGDQPGGDHGGFDRHLEPGKKAQKDAESGVKDQAVAAAAEAQRASGKGDLPGALGALIGEILSPKVSWQDQLKATMLRHGGDPILDWSRPDKRLISRPAPYDPVVFARQAHTGAGTIVVGYDSSGSCVNPEVQQRFFSEMVGILDELNPERLIIIWCDARVQRVDDLDEPSDLNSLRIEINDLGGAPGGGGTAFEPVFEWVEQQEIQPDMLVYLTDTQGSFPDQEPHYPVIWCSIWQGSRVPFGELIEVEL